MPDAPKLFTDQAPASGAQLPDPPAAATVAAAAPSLAEHLQRVTEALAATDQQSGVLSVVLTPALQALGALAGAVLLVGEESADLLVARVQGYPEGVKILWQNGLLSDQGPATDVLRSHQDLFFEHAGELSAAYPQLEERLGAVTAVASAILPMFLDGRALGTIVLDFREPHRFTPRERQFLRTLAAQCAIALGRAATIQTLELRVEARTRQMLADATTQEALNEALRRERIFLRAVLANLSEGVVACDEHGKLTLFNDATRIFHGLDPAQLAPEAVPPETWAERYDLFEGDGHTPLSANRVPLYRAWSGELLRDAEMVIRPVGGSLRQLLASGQPMFAQDGQPLGAVVTMRDVTARKAAEERRQAAEVQLGLSLEQLVQTNAELRGANEELEAFAYSASHDLRTPVRHIQSFAELARRSLTGPNDSPNMDSDPGTNPAALRYLGFVEQAAVRMSTLIDAMLLLARSSRQGLSPEPVKLDALLEAARRDAEADLAGHTVRWRFGALPEVSGDRVLLGQVLSNLLANAVKFSRTRPDACVEVWAEAAAASWTISVRDNGVGFDETYKHRLFGVFQRLHTEQEFEGTGVGLATVRRIILRHGGSVSASSVAGQGATFSFTLPRTR
ncbi:ATP-binding protein [Deinococcus sp.]|uniref:sensor histidine kinase n=1 Tax=Deinococcus sp. TaxID=47478 RepID=UPI0025F47612|nr:ATP-binding protein [Deinococcus sp.]